MTPPGTIPGSNWLSVLAVITVMVALATTVRTVVRTYEIRDGECNWIPTGGVGAPLLGLPQ